MNEEEKQKIENEFFEIQDRIVQIYRELTEITKREELIKTIESTHNPLYFLKKIKDLIKGTLPTTLILLFLNFLLTNIILIRVLMILAVIGTYTFYSREYIIGAIKANKLIKQNKKEYESAKEIEEKDKERKLSLQKEDSILCVKSFSLKTKLDQFIEEEVSQDLLDKEKVKLLTNNKHQTLEEQQEERPEIDTTQTLGMTFPKL